MENYDIGIDLGTTNITIYGQQGELQLLREPSVIALNINTDKIIAVGSEAHAMIGRTPDSIRAVMPLSDGVISDFDLTRELITTFVKKIYAGKLIKPRVIICVPSAITEVESNAVVSAALSAGARKVYLIEEPVAAALGANIDISRAQGNIIVDIGGGTTDVAVLSFNGVVCKGSLKIAGRKFDAAIIRYIRQKYNLLIGERMAEKAKIEVASALFSPDEAAQTIVKGRDCRTGMPRSQVVTREELSRAIAESVSQIVATVRHILEITPPELAADISVTGIVLTGGSAQLHGLAQLIGEETRLPVRIPPNPSDCVAIGTAKAFSLLGSLNDGFIKASTYAQKG